MLKTEDNFQDKLKKVKKLILKMVYEAQSGHIGGSFSIAGIVTMLYDKYKVNDINNKDSNLLIMSKGHAVPVMYACEYLFKGTITDEELSTFREAGSKLQGHPDKSRFPEMIASTGSLGQGLSIACGHALAKKKLGNKGTVFCIVGDGEMQEGQIYEALLFAGHHKLDNLCMIIDHNMAQNDGELTLSPVYSHLGFLFKCGYLSTNLFENYKALSDVLEYQHVYQSPKAPLIIDLYTKKGAGVSFMETVEWHAKAPNKEEYERALEELS